MKLKTKKSIYPIVIISIIVAFVVGYLVIAKITDRWPFMSQGDQSVTEDENSGDSTPPTDEEDPIPTEEDSQNNTERSDPTDNLDRDPSQGTQQSSARIHIPNYQSSGGSITVNISISEVWGDGQCVIRAEGPETKTARMEVFPAAQNSGCGPTISNLPPGHYTVTAWAERNGQRTNQEVLRVDL